MAGALVEFELDGQPLLPPEGQDSWMTDGDGVLKVPVHVRSRTAVPVALEAFPGCIVLVTHDVAFAGACTSSVVDVR